MNKFLNNVAACMLSAAVLSPVVLSGNVFADNKVKGLEIAKEVQDRDSGWGNSSAEMTMKLINKKGNTSERKMTLKTLEIENDGDKSLTVFQEPLDVEGTAFLSFSHALEADQQWLFLPALKRVKRISSSNKSGPFLGSEFAFEDLSSFEVEKYDYEFIRDDKYNDLDITVVKYIPKYEYSGYQFLEMWIDTAEYRIQKIDYYDRKGELLKTSAFNKYKSFLDGKYWRSLEYVVENHQTGKKTILDWTNYVFDSGLTDADFNKNALKRAK